MPFVRPREENRSVSLSADRQVFARETGRAREEEGGDGQGGLTGVAVPVKILRGLAVALVVDAQLLLGGAVGEGDVVVGDVVEEVDLVLWQQQGGGDGVHGRIAPALVEEAAVPVERGEVVNVGFAAQPVEVADFKVGPLVVISFSFVILVLMNEREGINRREWDPGGRRTKWQWL